MNRRLGNFINVVAIFLSIIAIWAMAFFGLPIDLPIDKALATVATVFESQAIPNTFSTTTKISIADPLKLTWRQVDPNLIKFPGRDSHATYQFNGQLFLTGGLDAKETMKNKMPVYEKAQYFNDIWSTTDGQNWQLTKARAEFPPFRSASVVEFKGSLYLFGGWSPVVGYKTGVWQSTDGLKWIKIAPASFEEREGQKVVVFDDKLWLIGGVNYDQKKTFNDVWVSADAVSWRQVVKNAPWHSRWDHDIAVFNNKIWLVGGMNFNGVGYGDEWYSLDGKEWQLATSSALWGKRQGQSLLVWDDSLWLVSGLDAKTNEGAGDTWFSNNGLDWNKTEVDGTWPGREDHETVIFKDKIFVIGGMSDDWEWLNDVWWAPMPKREVSVTTTSVLSTSDKK